MSADTELLAEIRDLLRIIAEPQIAERDKRLRARLLATTGNGVKSQQSVLLMTGNHSRSEIISKTKIDPAQLSRLVKALKTEELLDARSDNPKIAIPVPTNFFDGAAV